MTTFPDQPPRPGPDDQPLPGHPDPAVPDPASPDVETVEIPDPDGDPDADDPDPNVGAPLGSVAILELGQIGDRLGRIGRSAHNEFGQRLVIIAESIRDLAHEARRRLADDRLPPGAGTPDQQERRAAERDRHPTARDDG